MPPSTSTPRPIRRAWLVGISALLTTALAACGGAGSGGSAPGGASAGGAGSKGEVIVYDGGGAWGDAQRKAFFEPFEKETGIKVVPAPAPPPAQLQTAIQAGQPGVDAYDLSGTDLGAWRASGNLLQPIDYSAWPAGQKEKFKPYPTVAEGVPSLIFAAQLGYDPQAAGGAPKTWADFWDTKKFPGKRALGDPSANISSGTFEMALLADGVSPKKLYPLDIDRALRKLSEIKPSVVKFWQTGAESVQLLTDKQASATAAWNGRISSLQAQGGKIESTWNQAILEVDYWVIPKGAANTANANAFIEFASRPDRQAEFAKLIAYSPTNSAAYADIPVERRKVLPTAPDHVAQTIATNNDFWSSQAPSGKPWSAEIVDRWQQWLAQG